jgi:uncharacterized protein with HEPN domain
MLLLAVVRGIEINGEAATIVSAETRDRSPEIPWPAIVTMRPRLIHGSFDVDPGIVWRPATEEVPALIPRCATWRRPTRPRHSPTEHFR